MFKKVIKYTDFNGNDREETCFFNLSRSELMKMELSTEAGVEEKIRMLIATKDNEKIMKFYEDLLIKSYGIKSEDGTRFIKTPELAESFKQSAAYDEFFMELLTEPNKQQEFLNGVINGVNVPNVDEKEALTKLKELGYDTSVIEKAMANKEENDNKVVPINS